MYRRVKLIRSKLLARANLMMRAASVYTRIFTWTCRLSKSTRTLIIMATKNSDGSNMQDKLQRLVDEARKLARNGKVAKYIPALANANPNHVGVCIAPIESNFIVAGEDQ